jgi:hypothetical protein
LSLLRTPQNALKDQQAAGRSLSYPFGGEGKDGYVYTMELYHGYVVTIDNATVSNWMKFDIYTLEE